MPRRHGLNWPLHPLQVFLWLCLLAQVSINDFAILPVLPIDAKAIYSLVYHVSFILIIYFGLKTTLCDPSDITSRLKIVIQNKNSSCYCAACKSTVNKKSKHCMRCDRCVNHFDHHCKWVNNCIGQKNYKSFILCLISFLTNSISLFIFSLIILLEFFSKKSIFTYSDWSRYKRYENKSSWAAEIIFLLIYSILSSISLAYLIVFHMRLRILGMTTFEYILSKRKSPTVPNATNETIIKDGEVSITINAQPDQIKSDS